MSVSFSQPNAFLAANTVLPVWTPSVRPAQITFGASNDSVRLAKTVRFGSEFAGLISDWAKKVPDPPMTRASLLADAEKKSKDNEAEYLRIKTAQGDEAAKKYASQSGIRLLLDSQMQDLKLRYFEWRYSDSLVPAQVKSRVNSYKWMSLSGWRDWMFDNAHYQRMLVTLRGPIYIKEKQAWVQAQLGGPKQRMEATLKLTSDLTSFFKRSGIDDLPLLKRWGVKTLIHVISPFWAMYAKKQLRTIDALQPLQNKVPELPKSFFKEELALAQKEYNAAHTADPIVSIDDKALASGSIGQVYKAKTKSGALKVVKVARPDATQAFFEAYQPYAYYNEIFRTGTSPNQKARACVEVENNTRFLTGESNLGREKTNADAVKAELKRLDINGSLDILAPDFASSTGRSLVSDFVPGTDLIDLPTAEVDALKEQTVPKVLDTLLFSKTAKPLDIHNGNFRKKQNQPVLAWLDFGRQANLNADVYQHLNDLTVAVLAANGFNRYYTLDPERGLSSPLVSQALVNLFQSTPDSPWAKSAQALHASNQAIVGVEAELYGPIDPTSGARIKPAQTSTNTLNLEARRRELLSDRQKGELGAHIDQLVNLVSHLFAPASQLLESEKRKNLSDTGAPNQTATSGSSRYFYGSSLLSVWANYELMSKKLQNGVADLPALCANAVSKNDLSNYYQKTRQFMRPYFNLNDAHSESYRAKVANMSLAEMAPLAVEDTGYLPWQVRDLSKGLTEQLSLFLSQGPGRQAPDENVFKQELTKVLAKKGDKGVTEFLKLLYRNQHEIQLSEGLTKRYINETQASLGAKLLPEQIAQLTLGIRRGLSEDMSTQFDERSSIFG